MSYKGRLTVPKVEEYCVDSGCVFVSGVNKYRLILPNGFIQTFTKLSLVVDAVDNYKR